VLVLLKAGAHPKATNMLPQKRALAIPPVATSIDDDSTALDASPHSLQSDRGHLDWRGNRPALRPRSAHDRGGQESAGQHRRHHRNRAFVEKASDARAAADLRLYEAEQERAEREWYLADDEGMSLHDTTLQFGAAEGSGSSPARTQVARLSAKAAAGHHDSVKWEQSQMRASGTASGWQARGNDDEADEDAAPRVALVVKHRVPQFLSQTDQADQVPVASRVVLGSDVVLPVKDPTSDIAVLARKGSALVSEYREKRARGALRVKYWELGCALESKEKEEGKDGGMSNPDRSNSSRASFSQFIGAAPPMSSSAVSEASAIAESRRKLPVNAVRDSLLTVIRDNQVVVVVGETGSGKTTQLAQYLHDDGYTGYGIVGCTQPRRVAAVSVAQRVAEEFGGGGLGAEVGYAIRFEDCSGPDTVIKFMTDGILLRESLSDPDLERYSVIIMDEAHERSLNTDVLFGALRGVISRRRDLKVIITSATMNAERFSLFFGQVPVFRIPGRTFPVDIFYFKSPVEDYVDAAVFQVMQIHLQAPLPGDILVFMTGQEDIETTCEALADKISKLEKPTPLLILPIYSQLAADLQVKIFHPAPEGVRKVVVATNIAETSLTIDGIKFVVDSGFCKLKTYNPRLGLDALLICPASQAAVNQRAGRAGRTGPGKCYRLFTEAAYSSELLESNVPEIQRTNLSHVVLLLKSLGVSNVLEFPFLDPPPSDIVLKSMHGLWLLGALDENGALTELGGRMSRFPLDPGLCALLFSGEDYGCLTEALTIVAMLSVPNVFMRPHGQEEESDSAREKFFIPESDHLSLLHTFQRWRAAGSRADWCVRHFINSKGMRKALEVQEQLVDIAKSEGMELTSSNDWDIVRRAVGCAYYFQVSRRKGVSDYINVRSGVVCGLHPTSSIYGNGLTPDYVVYHELLFTKKEYMSCATAVEPQWLVESKFGHLLYTLRTARVQG
jgi:pre-mRNA-splicing factor ATP-dependent RNA helicase DHX38/PRP16